MEKLEINYLPNQTGSKFSLAITGMIIAAVGGFIGIIGIVLYGLEESPFKLTYEIVGGLFSLLGNILLIVFYSYFAKACHEVDEKLEKRINWFITFFSLAVFSNLLLTFFDSKFLLLNSVGGSIIGLIYYIIIANNLKGSYSGLMWEVGRLMLKVLYISLAFFFVALIFIIFPIIMLMLDGSSSSELTFLYWLGGIITLALIIWSWSVQIKLYSTMDELMVNGEDESNPLYAIDSQSDSETFEQEGPAAGLIQPFNIEYQYNAQTTTITNPGFYSSSHHVPNDHARAATQIEPEQTSQTVILPVHEKEKGPNNLLFYIISGILFVVIVGVSIYYYQSSKNQQYDLTEDMSNQEFDDEYLRSLCVLTQERVEDVIKNNKSTASFNMIKRLFKKARLANDEDPDISYSRLPFKSFDIISQDDDKAEIKANYLKSSGISSFYATLRKQKITDNGKNEYVWDVDDISGHPQQYMNRNEMVNYINSTYQDISSYDNAAHYWYDTMNPDDWTDVERDQFINNVDEFINSFEKNFPSGKAK